MADRVVRLFSVRLVFVVCTSASVVHSMIQIRKLCLLVDSFLSFRWGEKTILLATKKGVKEKKTRAKLAGGGGFGKSGGGHRDDLDPSAIAILNKAGGNIDIAQASYC